MKKHVSAVGVGICFGSVVGLLLHNIAIGIAIGAALGVAYERRHRNSC